MLCSLLPTLDSALSSQQLGILSAPLPPPPPVPLFSPHETFSEPTLMCQELTLSHFMQQPGRWPLFPFTDKEAKGHISEMPRPVSSFQDFAPFCTSHPGGGHTERKPRPALRNIHFVTEDRVTYLLTWVGMLGCLC